MKIGVTTYEDLIHTKDGVTALRIYVRVCNSFKNHTITDYTQKKIAHISGISVPTVRKGMKLLLERGIVKIDKNRTANFRSLKSKRANVNLDNLADFYYDREKHEVHGSSKKLKYLLLAEVVTVIQARKDFVKGLLRTANPLKKHLSQKEYREFKKARARLRKLGIDARAKFVDAGISFKHLAKTIRCSICLVDKIVKHGTNVLFQRIKRKSMLPSYLLQMWRTSYLSDDEIRSVLNQGVCCDDTSGHFFATRHALWWVRANLYRVLPCDTQTVAPHPQCAGI